MATCPVAHFHSFGTKIWLMFGVEGVQQTGTNKHICSSLVINIISTRADIVGVSIFCDKHTLIRLLILSSSPVPNAVSRSW
ncbi:hypothetical protein CGRA01v4_14651 [Colletotrichum graminicola]|nr:hypothetical protein CGRA01v4_14651 [Colletotrichum graminicola]